MDISVLLVNLNNLQFTKDCVGDLISQDCEFNLTIIDQNSSEEGTKEYFSTLPSNIEFIQNERNVPLNHLWNCFVINSDTTYICLLNNDVRIAPNFLSSAIQVLQREPNVGFVNHVSNNEDYQEWSNELKYKIIETPYRQGWDPIFRKESYTQIPNELTFFYGDDYIYSKLYSSGMKGAYVLNSPMIHFERSTTVEKGGQRDSSPDGLFFNRLDLEFKNMSFIEELSRWKPEFDFIRVKNLSLHDIGLKNNTDKATHHNFLNFYESKIVHLKNEKINLLEIGFLRGNSIKMWLEYFVNANIYCIDIIDIDFTHERFHYTKISQENKELKLLFNDNFFDIIVDDGSHITSHQLKSLEYLWSKLKYKGFYILEDLHTSFRSDYIDTDITPYQILSREKMIDELKNVVSEMANIEIFNKDPNSNWDSVTSVIKKCEKIKMFDFCIFNNEFEILDIRLEYMSKFIDKFYICEIDITHQSTKSEFYSYDFIEKSNIAKKLIDDERLEFVRLSLDPSDEYFAVEKNHRIKFSEWVRENVKGEFIGILSDCDEIISEDIKNYVSDIKTVTRLDLKMFYFTADNYSYLHPWNYFVKAFNSSDLKNYDFQTIREMSIDNIINNIGWHFSCFGGINQVIDKIKSYSHIEYNNTENTKRNILIDRLLNKNDYLGRIEFPCLKYDINKFPIDLIEKLSNKKHLLYVEELLKKEGVEFKNKTYITHVTRDYLEVALNLAKSVSLFSDLPLIVYCINLQEEDKQKFYEYKNVQLRNIDLYISEKKLDDYITVDSGNFYVNRYSARIYNILCAKTISMEMALEEGFDEVCYLDSDCLATPLVDELFNWMSNVTDYPIATQGIHEYMVWTDNGVQNGNPFAGGSWPYADNKLCLEWPLMSFLEVSENERGSYRTTGIMLMNKKCLPFIKTWRELCFILPKLVNLKKYATYHEETVYNVLSWKKTNKGFPLCYVNLGEGFGTVKHFYSDESSEGQSIYSNGYISQNFYKIPDNKRDIKVLHGEKRTSEVNLILDYLIELKNNNYFND